MKHAWLVALAALMLVSVGCQQEKTPEVAPEQKPAAEEQKSMTPEEKTALPVVNEKIEQAEAEEQKALAPEQKTAEKPAAAESKMEQPMTAEPKAAATEPKMEPPVEPPMAAEPKSPAPGAAGPVPPVTVVYDASYGKVSFDHAGHSVRLGCDSCHTTEPPVKIAIDKEKAHQMCKGCHQEKGVGPTKCTDCHQKG